MKSFTISLRDLSVLTGRKLTAQDFPAGELESLVRAEFGFLPKSVQIQVAGESITVSLPDEPEADQSEAARLCDRAGKRAAKGEYAKAIAIYQKVLELQPSLHKARRDLAMAYVEIGDTENAKNHLIEVLRLDPKDHWSWVVLGNIYAKQQSDWATAEKFLRKALELHPGDAFALNSLGAMCAERDDFKGAIQQFELALAANPKFANSRYGLALSWHRLGENERCLSELQGMFARSEVQDARSLPVFANARQLYLATAGVLAEKQHSEAFKAVENFKAQVESLSGFPVRVSAGKLPGEISAIAQMAWKHGRDYHLIQYRESTPPPPRGTPCRTRVGTCASRVRGATV